MNPGRRLAALDVGSNTVTGTVVEVRDGALVPLAETATITRLSRGLAPGGRFDAEALRDTLEAIGAFAQLARDLEVEAIVGVATAAARDVGNPRPLLEGAAASGVRLSVISGEAEAGLTWRAAWEDFAPTEGGRLAVIDVGGRSTEVIVGTGPSPEHLVSLPVGVVALTEAHLRGDPPSPAEHAQLEAAIDDAVAALPDVGSVDRAVAVAGTPTTLMTLVLELEAYDRDRVHGGELSLATLKTWEDLLWSLPLTERRTLRGMEPRRADVLPAGATLLTKVARTLGVDALTVSDRGVRWGLFYRP